MTRVAHFLSESLQERNDDALCEAVRESCRLQMELHPFIVESSLANTLTSVGVSAETLWCRRGRRRLAVRDRA